MRLGSFVMAVVLSTLVVPVTALAGDTAHAAPAATGAGICPEIVGAGHQPWLPEAWSVEHRGQNRSSGLTSADVDRDGAADVIWGDEQGFVHAHRANGSAIPGFPAPTVLHGATAPTAIASSPVVTDLDRDGDVEIVVGVGSLAVPEQPGGVVALDHTGRRLWSFRTDDIGDQWDGGPPDGLSEGVWSSPAVGDVDGDGRLDVVAASFDHRIYAFTSSGALLAGFPYQHYDSIWSSPALFDADGDGRDEIFIGTDSFPDRGGRFLSLDVAGGVVSVRWSHTVGEIFQSSAAIGDIDKDGRAEVVVGTGQFFGNPDRRNVWVWHADDGSPQAGFPVVVEGTVHSSPALGDVNGDGRTDIVVGDFGRKLYAIGADGRVLWARSPARGTTVDPGTGFWSSPILADVNGDGGQDVVITGGYGTYAVRGRDGARFDDREFLLNHGFGWVGGGSPLVLDVGGGGRQLVVAGFDVGRNCTRVVAYTLPRSGAAPAWRMWRGNQRHTAAPITTRPPLGPAFCRAPTNPSARPAGSSAEGYWILDRAGRVHAFDVPNLGGVAGRMPPGAEAVAITSTSTGRGYWILDSLGNVYGFGDAGNWGSVRDQLRPGQVLAGRIISMAALPTGDGYWLLGEDGGVFTFGEAVFHGSVPGVLPPGRLLDGPMIAVVPTTTGGGYWLIGDDGGMFTFGDAVFHGSVPGVLPPGRALDAPVISAAVHPAGVGYWMLGGDGGVFSFNVPFQGSVPGMGFCVPPRAVELRPTASGNGYFALMADGGIFTFGDAQFRGSVPGIDPVDLAVRW
jgi:hypothetical protein